MFQLGGLLQGEDASGAKGGEQQQHDEPGGDKKAKQQSRVWPSIEKESHPESWGAEKGRHKWLHWEHYGLKIFSNSKCLNIAILAFECKCYHLSYFLINRCVHHISIVTSGAGKLFSVRRTIFHSDREVGFFESILCSKVLLDKKFFIRKPVITSQIQNNLYHVNIYTFGVQGVNMS